MAKKRIIGYKAFSDKLCCKGNFQYEIGKTYKTNNKIEICHSGFHFCKSIADCFKYYNPLHMDIRICKVEALGDVIASRDNTKFVTNKIKILSEIKNFEELVNLSPTSKGYCNIGANNKGHYNTGEANVGNWNTGSDNTGNGNSGGSNNGNWNSGLLNIGDYNAGDNNDGSGNVGGLNVGNGNTGNRNRGDYNTGYGNDGNWNSGDWNKCDYSTGAFNTENAKLTIRMFNKPSDWTLNDWRFSRAHQVLRYCPRPIEHMFGIDEKNVEESAKNEAQKFWNNLGFHDRNAILSLPNFDAKIFEEITGIDVNKKET